MDHRPDQPLNDPALERDLESLLAVDPSPEFLARVRTRIASEPEPARWRLAWVAVPAMGMCIVLIATVTVMWSRPEPPAPVQAVTPRSVPPPIVEREPAVEVPRVARAAAERPVRAAAVADPFPEVVISEEEQRAFANLLLAVQQEKLPALVQAEDETGQALVPAPLEIEQLTIEPLQVTRLE